MTITKTEKINLLFEKIKTMNFFSWIFSWSRFRENSVEAFNQYQNLLAEQERLSLLAGNSENLSRELAEKKYEIENIRNFLKNKEVEIGKLEESNSNLEEKIQKLNFSVSELNGKLQSGQKISEQQQNQLGKLEENKSQLQMIIQEQKELISAKSGELNNLNREISTKESEIAKYLSVNQGQQEKIIELNTHLEMLKAQFKLSSDELERLRKENTIHEEVVEQKKGDANRLEKEIVSNQVNITNLQEQIKKNQNELGRYFETIEQNNNKILELNQIISAQEKSLENRQEDIQQKLKEISKLTEADKQNQNFIRNLELEKASLKKDLEQFSREKEKLNRELAGWEENETKRQEEHQQKTEQLQIVIKQLESEKEKLKIEREKEIFEKFEKMKKAWKSHEDNVQRVIIEICQRHNIEYIEKERLSFRGKPDNTLYIAGEYIIFDAKCPLNDDLENFQKYLQTQSENLKKYVKEDNVKKDIFLVVPSNTIISDSDSQLKGLKTFYYQMTDYRVFVVAIDSLEPVILNLKKIEEYEFAEKLSPEDRETICRIIAKFAHAAKRKIQIDSYLDQHLISILKECNSLPEDFQDTVVDLEKAEKLNPPQDRRGKKNSMKEIEKEIKLISNLADSEDINLESSHLQVIEEIPLQKRF